MTEQTTNQEAKVTVRKSITIDVPRERAFETFTAGFDRWWPRSHHIGEADMAEAVMEAREGGRWYERGTDGSECEWGSVRAYEPPRRVVLSWHLDPVFEYDPDPALATEVEVSFVAEGPDRTLVELEHRGLEVHGPEGAARMSAAIEEEEGWSGLLRRFAAEAMKG